MKARLSCLDDRRRILQLEARHLGVDARSSNDLDTFAMGVSFRCDECTVVHLAAASSECACSSPCPLFDPADDAGAKAPLVPIHEAMDPYVQPRRAAPEDCWDSRRNLLG